MPDSDFSPVCLTDMQLDAVLAAAHPLAPDRRSAFLEDVARELARLPEVGDGMLHRIIMVVQRRHFDPPDFGSGGKGVPQHTRKHFARRSAIEA
jgi:hypothetical protein